jgi:hypothetical protein
VDCSAIGQAAQREAAKHLNGADSVTGGAQNWAQFQADSFVASTNSLKGLAPRAGLEPATLRLTVARVGFAMDSDTVRLFSIHAGSVKVWPLRELRWFAAIFHRGVHQNGNQIWLP